MVQQKRRAVLVGLGAIAGAVGIAAMLSTASAPTARADDFSDIVAAVDANLADGQTAFEDALTAFGTGDVTTGLAGLFDGIYDDFVGAPDIAYVGRVEALTNETIDTSNFDFNSVTIPTDFSDALTEAQDYFTLGEGTITGVATELSLGQYGDAAIDQAAVPIYLFDLPLESLVIGGAEALGL